MMHWVENVVASIPEHSADVATMLTTVMNTKNISEIDAHACALAAALISSNGELGFAIEMFGPLQKARSEINLAKSAASLSNMHSIYNSFAELHHMPRLETHSTDEKFVMYSLAASVISQPKQADKHFLKLVEYGLSLEAIQDIVKIGAVINTIGKISPEVDQLIPSQF